MMSFCTLRVWGSSGTAPRARSKLVVRSQYESPRTKVDSIEKERKGRRREQRRRGQGAKGRKEEDGGGGSFSAAFCEHHKAPGRNSRYPFALFHFVFNSSQFRYCQVSPAQRGMARRGVAWRGARKTWRRVAGPFRLLLPRLLIANSTQSRVYTWHLSHDISIQRCHHSHCNVKRTNCNA